MHRAATRLKSVNRSRAQCGFSGTRQKALEGLFRKGSEALNVIDCQCVYYEISAHLIRKPFRCFQVEEGVGGVPAPPSLWVHLPEGGHRGGA